MWFCSWTSDVAIWLRFSVPYWAHRPAQNSPNIQWLILIREDLSCGFSSAWSFALPFWQYFLKPNSRTLSKCSLKISLKGDFCFEIVACWINYLKLILVTPVMAPLSNVVSTPRAIALVRPGLLSFTDLQTTVFTRKKIVTGGLGSAFTLLSLSRYFWSISSRDGCNESASLWSIWQKCYQWRLKGAFWWLRNVLRHLWL